ncbi:MAG: ZPR1 zinc finger domain-containing protein [archaeon]
MTKKEKEACESMAIECPSCSNQAIASEVEEKVPVFGTVLISSIACNKCGFKLSEVMPTAEHEPTRYTIKVSDVKDLETKVIKSSTTTLRIPELGVLIEPSPTAEGYFTNIEGVLKRLEDVAKKMSVKTNNDQSDEARLARKELARFTETRKGGINFTLILECPFGSGALIGAKVKKEELDKKQLEKLKEKVKYLDEDIEE